jgi:hypothetical protein
VYSCKLTSSAGFLIKPSLITFLHPIKNPNALTFGFLELVVPVGGLEPPRLAATDFESVVYTNFTTPALITIIDRFRKPDLFTLQ